MFHPQDFENARPDGFGVLEVTGDPGQPRAFVPLKRTELTGTVVGALAGLKLTQVFGHEASQCDRVLEARYRFPLPGDAAVTGVRVRFGDVEIHAQLKERQEAEQTYETAKREGRQAALVTRESPDVFTLQVAGLMPGQDVTVETQYVQRAKAEGDGWTLRVPLTTAPRYVRADEATGRHAQGQPLALLRDPGHRFKMELVIRGAGAVQSPTHALETSRDGDRVLVRLKDGEVVPDRDCVLIWSPRREGGRPTLEVTAAADPGSEWAYFLAQVAPPATFDRGKGRPREVIVLVDHSGSMSGPKWEAADWAVERFLGDLLPHDRFALGVFHTTTRWFRNQTVPASPEAVKEAIAFLKASHDGGGTELGVALEQALDLGRDAAAEARHVLIITDAEVSDAGRLLAMAEEESARPDRRRISVLCIDAAPNSHLAESLAELGGGVARFLTSDPAHGDITTALDQILADWSEPVLTGLRLEVDRPRVEGADHQASASSAALELGDLPAGRPICVAGRVPRGDGVPVHFRLTAGGKPVAEAEAVPITEAPEGRAIKALFGARRVRGLEYLIHAGATGDELANGLRRLGYEPEKALGGPTGGPKRYLENMRGNTAKALKQLLVSEALDYGLASSETAFVAERTEAGKPVEGTVAVANALPSGWSEDFLSAGRAHAMTLLPAGFAQGPPPSAPKSRGLGALFHGFVGSPLHEVHHADLDDTDECSASMMPASFHTPAAAPSPYRRAGALGSSAEVFRGVPELDGGLAVLFDSGGGGTSLPDDVVLRRLVVAFTGGAPATPIGPDVALQVFVDDLAMPRAQVKLADLIRQGGTRPLNLRRQGGQVVRIELIAPRGTKLPELSVTLEW